MFWHQKAGLLISSPNDTQNHFDITPSVVVILHDEVFGEFDDVVLLVVDEVVVEVAIKLSTGNKE